MPMSLSRRTLLVRLPAGLAAVLATGTVLAPTPLAAAPPARLWPHWSAEDPRTLARLDHRPLDRLLATYTRRRPIPGGQDSLFDYGAVTPADRALLDAYVAELAAVPITQFPRRAQFAFWVNLYNALVLQQVLAAYPVASIREVDLSGAFFTGGPWAAKLVRVERRALSLDDIQHRILRPIWRDPRVHYLLNCAALGCAHLAPEAVDAERQEAQRAAAARAFVNHPRNLRVGFAGLTVSSLYVWYGADFGYGRAAVMEHLRRYADGPRAALLAGLSGWADHDYDWRLNDAAPLQG